VLGRDLDLEGENVKNPVAANPNASAAAVAGAFVYVGITLASALGYEAPDRLEPALVTLFTMAVLFFGPKKAA
jgi:hypothetical protein